MTYMNQGEFEKLFNYIIDRSEKVLVEKAKEYAGEDGNRLHNFPIAAAVMGGDTTSEQACWAFMAKHLVSISDMVSSGTYYRPEIWEEKLGDALNYIILLWAIVAAGERDTTTSDSLPAHLDQIHMTAPTGSETQE